MLVKLVDFIFVDHYGIVVQIVEAEDVGLGERAYAVFDCLNGAGLVMLDTSFLVHVFNKGSDRDKNNFYWISL